MPEETPPVPAVAPTGAPAIPPVAPISAPIAPPVPVALTPAPVVPTAPVAAPAAPARPVKTLAELLGEKGPDEATKRLERAGRKALEMFGIELGKKDDIEAKAAEYKAQRDAKKAERQTLKAQVAESDRYKTALSAHMAYELGQLDDSQRAMIEVVAGKDPAAQLSQITALRAAGIIKPKSGAAATPPAPAVGVAPPGVPPLVPIPAPASSAPPQPGPVPTAPLAAKDIKAQIAQQRSSTKKSDKVAGAISALMNARALLPDDNE